MTILATLEKEQIIKKKIRIPTFKAGDTLSVHVRIKEGNRERIQVFEGICIARSNSGINSTFTVRKISYEEGVERLFPLYSPQIAHIDVLKIGRVRRAKLYYLRTRRGKSARIAEKRPSLKKQKVS